MTPAEITAAAKAGAIAGVAEAFGKRYDPQKPGDPAYTLREFLDAAPEATASTQAMAGELRSLRAEVARLADLVAGAK